MQNYAPIPTYSLSGYHPKTFQVSAATIAKIKMRHDFGDFASRAIVACLSKSRADRGRDYAAHNEFLEPPRDLVEVEILVSNEMDLAIDANASCSGNQPSRDAVIRACINWYFSNPQ